MVLDELRQMLHITPPQIEKLRQHLKDVQITQTVSGGHNLTLDQVIDITKAHASTLD